MAALVLWYTSKNSRINRTQTLGRSYKPYWRSGFRTSHGFYVRIYGNASIGDTQANPIGLAWISPRPAQPRTNQPQIMMYATNVDLYSYIY